MSQVQAQKVASMPTSQLIHTIIGISIMLFGRFIVPPTMLVESSEKLLSLGFPAVDGGVLIGLTPVGVTVLSLFFGVVYLWGTVDTLWPCFLGILLLGISDFAPMNQILMGFMGNPNTVLIFMLFIFGAALIRSQIAVYLARWLMTRKIVEGRPWVLTSMILFATYLVAYVEQVSSMFIMWPALYLIFKECGFKKGDKYVSLMVVNTLIMVLLSFAGDPIKGGAFYLVTNLYGLAASNPELQVQPINPALYLLFSVIISLVVLAVLLFVMRFIYRVDISSLKNIDINILRKNELPPMTWKQKGILVLFFTYMAWMLLPGLLPASNPLAMFLRANLMGGSLFIVFLLSFVQFKGESIADIVQTNAAFPWRVFFLIATAFALGNAVVSPSTNVTIMMEYLLRDWFAGLNYTLLIIAIVGIAIIVTNFCNSVVAGIMFTPVIIPLCNAMGFSPYPVLACFFFVVLVGAATPAASPYAAMLFDNDEWICKKDAFHYSIVASIIVVLTMIIVGVPLAKMFF